MADSAVAIEALRKNTAEIAGAKDSLIDINTAMQQELNTQAEKLSEGTTISSRGQRTTPLAIKQELQAEMEAQSANQKRAQSINYEDLSISLLDTIVKKGAEKAKALQSIEDINRGSIGEQIVGMFTIPGIQVRAEVAGEQVKTAGETLAAVNQAMQSSAKTTGEIQTKITDATIASMSSAIAADTAADAAKVRFNALQTSAHTVMQVAALNESQLKNRLKEYDIKKDAEQLAFMNEQRMMMRRQFDKEVRDGKIADQQVDLINLALESNGKQPIAQENRELFKDQMNKAGPQGEALRELLFQGFAIKTSGGQVVQGSTPAEAAEFRQKINYVPTTQAEQNTLDIVTTQFNAPEVREAKSKADKIDAANSAVLKKLQFDEGNVTIASDSLAKPASWATLATSKAITNNRLWKEVIAPTITDNISTNEVAPADMYTRLVAAVGSGKANINEASNLFTLYAGYSVEMNNANSGLQKLTGYKQTKFGARVPQPASGTLGFLGKAARLNVEFYTAPLAKGLEMAGIDPTKRYGAGVNTYSSAIINGLDQVAVSNAMALSIADQVRKQ